MNGDYCFYHIVTYMKHLRILALIIGFIFTISLPSCATTSSNLLSPTLSARDSFVKLVFTEDGVLAGSGSGVIIHHSDINTLILTAGHVCTREEEITTKGESFALDRDLTSFKVRVVKIYLKSDLCLLETVNVKMNRSISEIAHEMPNQGDRVLNLAAPLGIHGRNMLLQFEGYYSGRQDYKKMKVDFYTIPTKPGSSGSPIFNEDWEVIGIVSMVDLRLESLSLAATLEDIHEFLSTL